MKKIALFCLLSLLFMAFLISPDAAATEAGGNCGENVTWSYDTITRTLTISGTGEIQYQHPYYWDRYKKDIRQIVIEEGVTTISHNAFSSCSNLQTVVIPNSVTVIADYAFRDCYNLKEISLHDGITSLGGSSFSRTGLTEVTIPKSTTELANSVFADCKSLRSVVFHDDVETIGDYAFSGCSSLQSVDIPDSVLHIGGVAFFGCSQLSDVNIGNGVTSIGSSAFAYCNALTTIHIPDSVEKIRSDAFANCPELSNVTFGVGISKFEPSVFSNSPKVTRFVISELNPYLYTDDKGVIYTKGTSSLLLIPFGFSGAYEVLPGTAEICDYAADECPGLTSLIIPGSVKTIGEYAFYSCEALKEVTLEEGIEVLELRAFSHCGLTRIIIPSSVKKICGLAFGQCTELTYIYFLGDAPSIDESSFSKVTATAYYPNGNTSWTDYYWITGWNSSRYTNNLQLYGGILTWETLCEENQHSFGEWIQIKAPTTLEFGIAERMCSVCHMTEQKEVAKLLEPIEPAPTEPQPTEPQPTEPKSTEPEPTEPEPTEPEPTEPEPTEPEPTEPEPTEPKPTVPAEDTTQENSMRWVYIAACCLTMIAVAILVFRKRKM